MLAPALEEAGHELVDLDEAEAIVDFTAPEVVEGAIVLEVGAGTGALTKELLQKAGSVTALEPSAGLIERLGTAVRVIVEKLNAIEQDPSGKYRYVISRIARDRQALL